MFNVIVRDCQPRGEFIDVRINKSKFNQSVQNFGREKETDNVNKKVEPRILC